MNQLSRISLVISSVFLTLAYGQETKSEVTHPKVNKGEKHCLKPSISQKVYNHQPLESKLVATQTTSAKSIKTNNNRVYQIAPEQRLKFNEVAK
jgi:hypothetical protein